MQTGTRTATTTETTTGTNTRTYTSQEWYTENRGVLTQYGTPPQTKPISIVTSIIRTTTKGTVIPVDKGKIITNTVKSARTQDAVKTAVKNQTGMPATVPVSKETSSKTSYVAKTNKASTSKKMSSPAHQRTGNRAFLNTVETMGKGAWDYVLNPAVEFITVPLNAIYTGAKYAGKADNPLMAIPKALEGTLYGVLGGIANIPPPNLQMKYPKEWITGSVTEALSANDKKANDFLNNHPVLKAGIDLVVDAGIGLLMGGAIKSLANAFTNPAPKVTYAKETVRTFTSKDPLVADIANGIEAKFPGKVIDVNKIVKDSSGRILTDYDIELDNMIIQVKSGGGKGLTTQLKNTAASTNKTVIAYGPDIKPSVVKGVQQEGFSVFNSLDDLINFINK